MRTITALLLEMHLLLSALLPLAAISLRRAGDGWVDAYDVDNGVIGTPVVECDRDWVKFHVVTKKPFKGKVYVKGEYNNDDCLRSYGTDGGGEKTDAEDEDETTTSKYRSRTFHKRPSKRPGTSTTEGWREVNTPEQGEVYATVTPSFEQFSSPASPTRPWQEVRGRHGGREDEELLAPYGPPGFPKPKSSEHDGSTKHPRTSIRPSNQAGPSPTAGSQFPGFTASAPPRGLQEVANWRNFLRGRPGLDGQSFRRYGSRIAPDANGECPIICPPCEECTRYSPSGNQVQAQHDSSERVRRKAKRRKDSNRAELNIRLGACHARRDRTANPPGVHVSFTVIVSFHDAFITRLDRAYHVECAYEEVDRTVSTELGVSPPPVVELSGQMEPPRCHYTINGPGGRANDYQSLAKPLTSVHVGDEILHEWVCERNQSANFPQPETTAVHLLYGLLVHDCYVDDGHGRKVLMVDSKGCSTDSVILPTPSYAKGELKATASSLVAKFPDQDLLGFQCAITVCMRELGHCDGVTPPLCTNAYDASTDAAKTNVTRTRRSAAALSDSNWQLSTPLLTVFDVTDDGGKGQASPRIPRPMASALDGGLGGTADSEFCVSLAAFGVLIASSTFLITISAAMLIAILFLRSHHYQAFISRQLRGSGTTQCNET